MTPTGQLLVSVIIPCRNEIHNLPMVLAMLRAQTLQPDEVIFADGLSTDGTREALGSLNEAFPVRVLDNQERHVPYALNLALDAVRGKYVARMDTHAEYASEYLERVVAVLEKDPSVAAVGGAMQTSGRGDWGRAIAATLGRRFGLGGAGHRSGADAGPVPHVFSGCYRADVLRRVGGWNTQLRANEDFEADVRVSRIGQVWLEPAAHSTWFVRESLPALSKQMWRYGFYKAATLVLHPTSLKLRQLAPPLLVASLIGTALVSRRAMGGALSGYLLISGLAGASAAHQDAASPARGALVPAVVHFSWGSGLLSGLAVIAFSTGADQLRAIFGKQGTHHEE